MAHWDFNAGQIFSYYPKHEYLDDVMTVSKRKRLNLFIDFKGCAKSLYQEWCARHMLSQSRGTNACDTSLFASVLQFISFHKKYARKRGYDINFYFFMESGPSGYHKDVYKDYKSKRTGGYYLGLCQEDKFMGLDKDEAKDNFEEIVARNYFVAERVTNKLPNVQFVKLDGLEADFIPFYLMNYIMSPDDVDSAANIIYSADKDMYQCLDRPNIFQFWKIHDRAKMVRQQDIYKHWMKVDVDIPDPAKWFPLALAIIGDEADGFAGVNGIGGKTLAKILPQLIPICGGDMDIVYAKMLRNEDIFLPGYENASPNIRKILYGTNDKIIKNRKMGTERKHRDYGLLYKDIVVRNLKLASFKYLSDIVDNLTHPAVQGDKGAYKVIQNAWTNTVKVPDAGVLIDALRKAGVTDYLTEEIIVDLF